MAPTPISGNHPNSCFPFGRGRLTTVGFSAQLPQRSIHCPLVSCTAGFAIRPIQHCNVVTHASQRQLQQLGSSGGVLDEAALITLKKGVKAINKLISYTRQRQPRQEVGKRGKGAAKQCEVLDGKVVTFTASTEGERFIREPNAVDHPNHSLLDYLALPLEEYSVLDPRFIAQDPGNPELFHFHVPLDELIGMELHPQMDVKVTYHKEDMEVQFTADGFKLGDPNFDDSFQVDMQATLRSKPVMDVAGLEVPISWRSTAETRRAEAERDAAAAAAAGPIAIPHLASSLQAPPVVEPSAIVLGDAPVEEQSPEVSSAPHKQEDAQQGSSSPLSANPKLKDVVTSSPYPVASFSQQEVWQRYESEGVNGFQPVHLAQVPTATLSCTASVTLTVALAPPLSVLPGMLTSITGDIMTRLVLGSLLPTFLDMLVIDYERWASGLQSSRSEPAGSLLPREQDHGGDRVVFQEGNISVYSSFASKDASSALTPPSPPTSLSEL